MVRISLPVILMATVLSTPVLAQSAAPPAKQAGHPQPDQTDTQFLKYVAYDNQGEINLCLLAEKNAASPALKAFARLMVNDHVQIESELAAVANKEKFVTPNGVGPDADKTMSELEPLSGTAFDTAFLKDQIKDHSQDIERFSKEAAATQDSDIKRFAELNIPILQQHLALAKAVLADSQHGGAS